jgi:hypothetical protein
MAEEYIACIELVRPRWLMIDDYINQLIVFSFLILILKHLLHSLLLSIVFTLVNMSNQVKAFTDVIMIQVKASNDNESVIPQTVNIFDQLEALLADDDDDSISTLVDEPQESFYHPSDEEDEYDFNTPIKIHEPLPNALYAPTKRYFTTDGYKAYLEKKDVTSARFGRYFGREVKAYMNICEEGKRNKKQRTH